MYAKALRLGSSKVGIESSRDTGTSRNWRGRKKQTSEGPLRI